MILRSPRPCRPIFIIGSPRSGTSILSWCLGQHSNIFVQEESNWIGRFAVQVGAAYEVGSARGERSQLSALDVQRADFFALFGASINNLVLDHRTKAERKILERSKHKRTLAPAVPGPKDFQITRSASDPKQRWIDGTPEYSFYVCALRKLFPEARFIHVVREVDAVVRSILNFHRTGGPRLAANEQQAYEYWLRTVRCCMQAERAYGSQVVRRIRYSELVDRPEFTVQSLLNFLNEPYEPACLQPLQSRINSSRVPADFNSSDPQSDPAILEEAKRLDSELANEPQPVDPLPDAAAQLEAAFNERVRHFSTLESDHMKSLQRIAQLQKEVDMVKNQLASQGRDPFGKDPIGAPAEKE